MAVKWGSSLLQHSDFEPNQPPFAAYALKHISFYHHPKPAPVPLLQSAPAPGPALAPPPPQALCSPIPTHPQPILVTYTKPLHASLHDVGTLKEETEELAAKETKKPPYLTCKGPPSPLLTLAIVSPSCHLLRGLRMSSSMCCSRLSS